MVNVPKLCGFQDGLSPESRPTWKWCTCELRSLSCGVDSSITFFFSWPFLTGGQRGQSPRSYDVQLLLQILNLNADLFTFWRTTKVFQTWSIECFVGAAPTDDMNKMHWLLDFKMYVDDTRLKRKKKKKPESIYSKTTRTRLPRVTIEQ